MMASILCGLTRFISGLTVRWCGCLPEDKQRVYFANHSSHLDFMVIWAALPGELRVKTRPVAAKDYWDSGVIRRYIARNIINAVLIERNDLSAHDLENNPVYNMLDALDKKFSLIIFPEGARNREDDMKPFKSGLFHLINKRPGIECIPVYLENLSKILPKGEFLPIPILGSVTFGAPLVIKEAETKNDFLSRARLAIEGLKNL